jgi:hypothetical protein
MSHALHWVGLDRAERQGAHTAQPGAGEGSRTLLVLVTSEALVHTSITSMAPGAGLEPTDSPVTAAPVYPHTNPGMASRLGIEPSPSG